ncbi:kynureninase [Streptomyces caatingaensis]|uniref:kynureninase n=1 Tax=Streptomyces caatingaensis TaxID=1678637 RepID=UPI00099BE41D|nr:kynureninase [Streptomyces caatingaensis]
MTSRATAERLDRADPLARTRASFDIPPGVVYLDGNSLGALPRGVPRALDRTVRQWRDHLIKGWTDDGWLDAPTRTGDRVGRLLGAAPGQTVAGDSTSVQLFNALVTAARLRPERTVLLYDADGFPTDRYLASSVARLLGLELRPCRMGDMRAALEAYGQEVAVVLGAPVDFRTGELFDIAAITARAHRAGAVTVWDLCHAAGALPLSLDADGVDLAVGCGYKFLSGGPGAPAYLYVARRHRAAADQPLTGWLGHAAPFAMAAGYRPAEDMSRFRIGAPPMLSLSALDAALDVFDGVSVEDIRAKNTALGRFFIECFDEHLAGLGFGLVTPRAAERRSSQVTLSHPHASELMDGLAARGVLGDVRPPALLRFGFNSLYVSYTDIHHAVTVLAGLAAPDRHRPARTDAARRLIGETHVVQ